MIMYVKEQVMKNFGMENLEEHEDTKEVIRIRKSKDRQYNG
jgi:hypothetical protein